MEPHRVLRAVPVVLFALLLAAPRVQAGMLAGNCRVSDQPAATLLVPYFEVDLDAASGATTIVSINNASPKSELARVVLWTDWGVPTLAFDVYLTGYDVQTLNVRDLFEGALPATGFQRSPNGEFSKPSSAFPGCEGAKGQADSAAADSGPGRALANAKTTFLRAAHTGRPLNTGPAASQCIGSGAAGPHKATGYVTIDVVNRCSPSTVATIQNTPAHALYFAPGGQGLAANDNVLWGDVTYVDPAKGAQSVPMVHVVADGDFFAPGDYTFYGRYVGYDARDSRAPLASLYYSRFVNGGALSGGTDLLVWRDNRVADVAPRPCGTKPAWTPLGEMQLVAFDEQENPTALLGSNAFPLATQKVHVGSPALAVSPNYGWLMMDLWHADSTHAQGSVTVLMSTGGRYTGGYTAVRADDLCNFGL